MPELCRFLGMIITMHFNDHAPPHFHVRYSDFDAVIRLGDLALIRGHLPPRALGLVVEWAALHREELTEDWRRAQQSLPLNPIAPLE